MVPDGLKAAAYAERTTTKKMKKWIKKKTYMILVI